MNLYHATLRFDGIFVIGDIHADDTSLLSAVEYAKIHNLFLISLGDLVDRGTKPFETLEIMLDVLDRRVGAFVIGNHDDKHYRNAIGNPVVLTGDPENTLAYVGDERKEEFLSNICALHSSDMTDYYHYIDEWVFVHGATHEEIWNYSKSLTKIAKFRAIYGEVTGLIDAEGKPERAYGWIDKIPKNKYAVVGHDRKPLYDKPIRTPLMHYSHVGKGNVVFVDTGCGKGGRLSGVELIFTETDGGRRLFLSKFVGF